MNLINAKSTALRFEILSEQIWEFTTHYVGKTHLCPAYQCVLCGISRPSTRGYCIARVFRRTGPADEGLFELTHETMEQIRNTHRFDVTNALGSRWIMERRSTRPGWKIQPQGRNPEPSPCDTTLLPNSLEALYRLPYRLTSDGEIAEVRTNQEWLRAHQRPLEFRMNAALRTGATPTREHSQP